MRELTSLVHGGAAEVSHGKWLERGFLVAIVLGCAVAMSPNAAGPDLWGHVQYGRDLLAYGSLPTTATYSFTAEGYRWINHEILAELLLAIGADTVGAVGLVVAKFLLSLLVILLVIRQARRQGARLLTVCVVALLVAVNMGFHWSVRPQLLTYIFFTLMIALLTWCFDGWHDKWRLPGAARGPAEPLLSRTGGSFRRMRWLWLAPVLFLFWANSHGGFVAGYCIYSAYLFCRGLEVLAHCGRRGLRRVGRLGWMIAAAGLATLVNPYGPRLHLWLIESLAIPRPEITEWQAPELLELGSVEIWLLIGLFTASIVMTRRRRDFTHLVLLTLTLWQSLEHLRHLPFFAILFGFWMPVHVESLFRRLRISRPEGPWRAAMSPAMRRVMVGGLGVALVLLVGRLAVRLNDLRVDRSRYPVAAMQFIADRQLSGRMVATYNWAQYAIAAFGRRSDEPGGIQVSFDGRFRTCYPQEIADMNFDFVLGDGGPRRRHRSPGSRPFDAARVLRRNHPDLVLISRRQPHSEKVMREHRDRWVLLYQDELAQLWGLRAKYDDPSSPHYLRPGDRIIGDAEQEGYVSWPALPVLGRKETQLVSN